MEGGRHYENMFVQITSIENFTTKTDSTKLRLSFLPSFIFFVFKGSNVQRKALRHCFALRDQMTALLRKQTYSNLQKLLSPKNGNFQTKIWYFSDFCSEHRVWSLVEPPRLGGSNECPLSMVLSSNKKMMYTPVNPSFTI